MGQKLSDLNPSEMSWVSENVGAARQAVVASGYPLADGAPVDPPALDAAWTAWLSRWVAGTEDANPSVNMFGVAFGQYLVDHLGLSWKVVEDEYGTEMAVHGQPGDILVFPPNLVAKRLESRTTDFFVPVAAGIEAQVAKVRDAGSGGGGSVASSAARARGHSPAKDPKTTSAGPSLGTLPGSGSAARTPRPPGPRLPSTRNPHPTARRQDPNDRPRGRAQGRLAARRRGRPGQPRSPT